MKKLKPVLTLTRVSILALTFLVSSCTSCDENIQPHQDKDLTQITAVPNGGPRHNKKSWVEDQKKCLDKIGSRCISSNPSPPSKPAHEDFLSALRSGSKAVQDYFEFEKHLELWPDLHEYFDVSKIITGESCIITVYNSEINQNFYLIGQANLSDEEIITSPELVLHF